MTRSRRQRLYQHIRKKSANTNAQPSQADEMPRALMVLGMHRSGTSALTRIFSLLGADLPKNLMPPNPANTAGYWESQDLMTIHDQVLSSGGSTWDDWRAFNPDWFNSPAVGHFKNRILDVLRNDFIGSQLFVIKDPRICRLWPLWRDVLEEFGAKPLVVLPIRNPLEVAASLKQRDEIIPAKTHLLWLRHVLDAESATRGLPRAIISFESLIEDRHSVIGKVASRLGLSWPRRGAMAEIEIEEFLSTQIKHHTIKRERLVDNVELMDWLKETYAILANMAEKHESRASMARLDQIRAAFDKASAAFGVAVAMTEIELGKQKAAVSQLSDNLSLVRETAAERERQEQQAAASLSAELEAARAASRDGEVALTEAESRAAARKGEHQQAVASMTADLEAARASAQDREVSVAEAERRIAELSEQHAAIKSALEDVNRERGQLAAALEEEKETAARNNAQADLLRQELETLRSAVREHQTTAAKLRTDLYTAQSLSNDRKSELDKLSRELMSVQSTMRDSDAQIDRLGPDADAARLFLRESQSEVQRLAGEVDTARVEIERANAERQRVSDAFVIKSNELNLAHSRMELLQGISEELRVTAAQLGRAESEQLRAELAQRGSEGEQLRAELAKSGIQLDRITQQVNLIQKSKSWRLRSAALRPITAIYRIIGKISSDKSQERRLIIASGLFDKKWYLSQYPDVKKSKVDPALHYLLHGALEGRDPSPHFETVWYMKNNPDVAAAKINALVHYINFGRKEGRVPKDDYRMWVDEFEALDENERKIIEKKMGYFASRPLISILMPVYNTKIEWLERAINSVQKQIYQNWELCLSDDASTDPQIRQVLDYYASKDLRIKVVYREHNGHISANTNTALGLAKGEFIALMDADDEISEYALFWIVHEINQYPNADLIYSDEDKITETGARYDPYFKPDWNPSLIQSQNVFCHLGVYRRTLVNQVGGLRLGFEGAQDHDLVLRCAELTTAPRIRHIPRVLYHWRAVAGSTAAEEALNAKPYAWEAGARAIKDHLNRQGIPGTVQRAWSQFFQVEYELSKPLPKVSILIPTRFDVPLVERCLETLLRKTTYPNIEVLVIINNKLQKQPEEQERLTQRILSDARVKILYYEDKFNYSRINNWAAKQASGTILCFLNDDIEIVTEDWLEKVVARLQLPQVGTVGVMLNYPDDKIQHAGVILGFGGVAGHQFLLYPRGAAGYFARGILEQDLSCVTAACMGIRRELFDQLGGFNEKFGVAFNDVDLCIRIKQAGWRIIWTPTVEHYHNESASLGPHNSPERAQQFEEEINLMRSLWGNVLDYDPAYNPNLSLTAPFYRLSFPPRIAKTP
jgi:glycosyltransferase involved in cell wall biosynthesis